MVASISHDLRTPLNSMMILLNCAKSFEGVNMEFYEKFI